MKYLKITKYAILIYGDLKGKFMFFMLFFTYSRYFNALGAEQERGKTEARVLLPPKKLSPLTLISWMGRPL